MPPATSRSSRIEARISPEALNIVKRAAELQGRSVSDFVIAAAQAAAHKAIEDIYIIRLSVEDQINFASSVFAPAKSKASLTRAAKTYRNLAIKSF